MSGVVYAATIAAQLSRGQRSVVRGLSGEPALLDCGEPVARRLARPTKKRPALVEGVIIDGVWQFRLTLAGARVQTALAITVPA